MPPDEYKYVGTPKTIILKQNEETEIEEGQSVSMLTAYTFDGSGEIDFAGAATNIGFAYRGSGGIAFAGQAELFTIDGRGTIAFGGQYKFIPAVWPIYKTLGGIQFAGRARRKLSATFISKGSTCRFSSAYSSAYETFCSLALDLAGHGGASVGFHRVGAGSLALGGQSAAQQAYRRQGGGTIAFAGSNQRQPGFNRIGGGTITFAGSSQRQQAFTHHRIRSGWLSHLRPLWLGRGR